MQAAAGDMAGLSSLLAEDAILISDGGGKRTAALRPMIGRDDVMLLLNGLAWRGAWSGYTASARAVMINGLPGAVIDSADGVQTIAFEADEDGKLAAIYIMRNPDKLGHVRG